MKRTQLFGLTGLLAASGVGGYLICGSPDCDDPGYLTVTTVAADGSPARVGAVEYTVAPDPRSVEPPAKKLTSKPLSASCIDEGCTKWKVAPGDNGEVHVKATVCGKVFEDVALVDRDADGCNHGQRELEMIVDVGDCVAAPGEGGVGGPGDIKAKDEKVCTMEARTSVVVNLWKRHSDYFAPATPESVTYKVNKKLPDPLPPATCLNDRCTSWGLAYEIEGSFDIAVTSCGKTHEHTVRVPMTEDGCHVDTQRVDIYLDGHGCLAGEKTGHDLPPDSSPTNGPKLTDKPADGGGADPAGTAADKIKPAPPMPPGANPDVEGGCDPSKMASNAFVANLVNTNGDMLVPIDVEYLTFQVNGEGEMLRAVKSEKGWEGPAKGVGTYNLRAPICGKDVKLDIEVPRANSGCGVETQYLMWEADKTGCLSGVKPGDGSGPDLPLKDKPEGQ